MKQLLNLKAKELAQVERLISEVKLEEAFRLLNEYGKKQDLSIRDEISYYILKSSLLRYFFQIEESLKYAQKAYQKSQNFESSLQLLDVYIQMAMTLNYWHRPEESLEFLVKAEKLLGELTEETETEIMERKASIFHIKGWFYLDEGELDKALKFAQRCLEIREEIDLKVEIGITLWQIGWIYFMNNNDLALKYADQCLEYSKKINYKNLNQECNRLIGMIYLSKGELDQALKYFKQSKELFEELSKEIKFDLRKAMLLHLIGCVYQEKNDLNRAKEHFVKALTIKKEIGNNAFIMTTLDSLISLTLIQGDLESAENYLRDLKRISDKEDSKLINFVYRLNMARLLKISPLGSDRAKAEEILKLSLEDKVVDNEGKIIILLNLSDLFLDKLRETNDLKFLDEIQSNSTRIHNIAKDQQSYSLLAENHLLQAKLQLLSFDLKAARHSLTQAQQICEKYDLNRIKLRVNREQEKLTKLLNQWEELKNSEANISLRMDLAGLGEQLRHMLRKRIYLKTNIE